MSKYLKPMKLKQVKGYRYRLLLERKIKRLNNIRDSYDENNKMMYPWILRFVAGIFSRYYTNKWERWYN